MRGACHNALGGPTESTGDPRRHGARAVPPLIPQLNRRRHSQSRHPPSTHTPVHYINPHPAKNSPYHRRSERCPRPQTTPPRTPRLISTPGRQNLRMLERIVWPDGHRKLPRHSRDPAAGSRTGPKPDRHVCRDNELQAERELGVTTELWWGSVEGGSSSSSAQRITADNARRA